jgi:hypothetical protein
MKIIDLIRDNGLTEKWDSDKYSLAIEVIDDGLFDAIVCAGPGLSSERLKFREIDMSIDIPDDQITLVHMIPKGIWESMKTTNALNEDKP